MVADYAEAILDASRQLREARNADAALVQLGRLNALAEDLRSLEMLASAFLLVSSVWCDEQDAAQAARNA